jgi:hypothetical protein
MMVLGLNRHEKQYNPQKIPFVGHLLTMSFLTGDIMMSLVTLIGLFFLTMVREV